MNSSNLIPVIGKKGPHAFINKQGHRTIIDGKMYVLRYSHGRELYAPVGKKQTWIDKRIKCLDPSNSLARDKMMDTKPEVLFMGDAIVATKDSEGKVEIQPVTKARAGDNDDTFRAKRFNRLVADAHEAAVKAGWHHDLVTGEPKPLDFPKMIALAHSELSEALEANRKNLMDDKLPEYPGEVVELIDLTIRAFDTIGAVIKKWADQGVDIDPGVVYVAKRNFNDMRQDHKPENRRAVGGKGY